MFVRKVSDGFAPTLAFPLDHAMKQLRIHYRAVIDHKEDEPQLYDTMIKRLLQAFHKEEIAFVCALADMGIDLTQHEEDCRHTLRVVIQNEKLLFLEILLFHYKINPSLCYSIDGLLRCSMTYAFEKNKKAACVMLARAGAKIQNPDTFFDALRLNQQTSLWKHLDIVEAAFAHRCLTRVSHTFLLDLTSIEPNVYISKLMVMFRVKLPHQRNWEKHILIHRHTASVPRVIGTRRNIVLEEVYALLLQVLARASRIAFAAGLHPRCGRATKSALFQVAKRNIFHMQAFVLVFDYAGISDG